MPDTLANGAIPARDTILTTLRAPRTISTGATTAEPSQTVNGADTPCSPTRNVKHSHATTIRYNSHRRRNGNRDYLPMVHANGHSSRTALGMYRGR